MIHYAWPIVWMGVIFFFSTDAGSSSNTLYYLEPILGFLFPHLTPDGMLLAHQLTRKLAHLAEYAILSYFWFIALRRGKQRWSSGWALLALSLSIFYALLDEYHQGFVPSRTASLIDVGIDSMGALVGQACLFVIRSHPLHKPPSDR